MNLGYLESESLKNPLVLNSYKPIKVEVEYVPTSKTHPYVHAYYLKFQSQDEMERQANKFSKLLLPEWYLLFWNRSKVFAIFKDKVFKLNYEDRWKSNDYKKVQEYGVKHGIDMIYMDFNRNFARFFETLKK